MKRRFIFLCLVPLAPGMALAQVDALDQNRLDRRPLVQPNTAAPARPKPAAPTIVNKAVAAPAAFTRLVVEGSSLKASDFDRATGGLRGRPLTQPGLQAIAQAAARVYEKGPIALYQLEIPAQDFAGGLVRLRVVEGHVGQVALRGDAKNKTVRLLARQGAPLTREAPLRKKTLQRQLSLMRDTPGFDVRPQILATPQPGAVALLVDAKPRPDDVSLSLTTRGSRNLGRVQLQADYASYGLLRGGDFTRLTVSVPTELKRFQYVSLTHNTPLGADGLRLQGSAAYLRTRPKGSGGKGEARIGGLQLSYPAIRTYETSLYLAASLDGLDSRNAAFGQVLSSEKVTAGRFSANWSWVQARRSLQASAAGSHGEAKLEGALPRTADAHFSKLNLALAYNQVVGKRLVFRTRAMGQFTDDRLPASELVSLGGDAYGRAFDQSALMGDEGAAAALELAVRPKTPKALGGSEVYVFGDRGRVRVHGRYGLPGVERALASSGAGVRVTWRERWVAQLEAARAEDAPAGLKRDGWRLGFSLRASR